jgi:hypothetical protein
VDGTDLEGPFNSVKKAQQWIANQEYLDEMNKEMAERD